MQSDGWIVTYTGRFFFPLKPSVKDICIEDIAHSLSNLCRFNGHTCMFYSVAEHSIHVSELLPDNLTFLGLMHDAAEAYIGDWTSPVKELFPEVKKCENRIFEKIAEKYNLTEQPCPGEKYGLTYQIPALVKSADLVMRAIEARDQMVNFPSTAAEKEELAKFDIILTDPMKPEEAEARFLELFAEYRKVWDWYQSGHEQHVGQKR